MGEHAASRQESVRVNDELDVYRSMPVKTVSKQFAMRSAFQEFSHTGRILNWVHTELKPHRPDSTSVDRHRNPCQYLMRYREYDTVFVIFKFFYTDFNSVLISVLTRF
jgi:hypothetical protein